LRVRAAYRSKNQRDDHPEIIFHRLILLQKLATPNMTAIALGDFVVAKETPVQIVDLIEQQTLRLNFLSASVQLATDCFSVNYSPIWIEIFAFSIAKISNFEPISRIRRLSNMENEDFIHPLFGAFLNILHNKPLSRISLICFRIFRDCPDLIVCRRAFIARALDCFCNIHPSNLPLFALCLSIIDCVEELPPFF
jgi:hypothetical protein